MANYREVTNTDASGQSCTCNTQLSLHLLKMMRGKKRQMLPELELFPGQLSSYVAVDPEALHKETSASLDLS